MVDEDAIGIFERIFHARVGVNDLFLTVFTADKLVDKLHRAGPIQRHHGDDIFESRRLELTQVTLHAGRFELENAGRIAALQQAVSRLVVEWNGIDIDVFLVDPFDDT